MTHTNINNNPLAKKRNAFCITASSSFCGLTDFFDCASRTRQTEGCRDSGFRQRQAMFRQARSASKPQEAQNTAFLNRICRKTPRRCHENLVFSQFLGLLYTSPLIQRLGPCEQNKLRKR